MSAEIATQPASLLAMPGKRAAAAGEYWSPKYLCLASCGIAVRYVPEIATTAGKPISNAWEKSCRSWQVLESKRPMPGE